MAATDVIAELAVNLRLDSSAFARGSSTAAAQSRKLEGRMKGLSGAGSGVTKVLSGLGGFFAGGFLAGGVAGAVSEVGHLATRGLELASSLGEVSQQLGVTSHDLQVYRYAAGQVGIEQDEMDRGLARLTKSLGQAAAGGKQAKVFQQLGIDIHDANGHVKTAGQVIPILAEALHKLPDAASRAAVEVALFGKEGQKLDTLLAGGAKGVNDLTGAAEKLGLVLSPEQIKKADDARDKFDALKKVLEAKIAGVVADNADAILKLATAAADLGTRALAGLDGFSRWVQGVKERLGEAGGHVDGFQQRVDAFDKRMGIPTQRQFIDSVAAQLQTMHDRINQSLKDIQDWAGGVDAKLAGAWHAFDHWWSEITASTAKMVQSVENWLKTRLSGAMDWVKQKAHEVGDAFAQLYDRVVGHSYVPDMVKGIGDEFKRLDEIMVNPAVSASDKVAAAFQGLATVAGQVFGSKAGGIFSAISSAVSALLPLFSGGGFNSGSILAGFGGSGASAAAGIGGHLGSVAAGAIPRAAGGPVVPGRKYRIGEHGPEYVSFGSAGTVTPNKASNDGGLRIQVVKGDLFDVIVDHRAARVAAPMAGNAAVLGAAGAEMRSAKRMQRTIP